MDKRIRSFIESQKKIAFCTSFDNFPHCASCFYTYVKEVDFIVFKSDKNTKHISNALQNKNVAGAIHQDQEKIGSIKGIQFIGKFTIPGGNFLQKVKKEYTLKYPFSIAIHGDLWAIELVSVKMTDNTLGFGKKLTWEKIAI